MSGITVQGHKTVGSDARDVTPLLEKARSDAKLRARLAEDPLGTAKAEGYDVSLDDVRRYLNLADDGSLDDIKAEARRELNVYFGGAAK